MSPSGCFTTIGSSSPFPSGAGAGAGAGSVDGSTIGIGGASSSMPLTDCNPCIDENVVVPPPQPHMNAVNKINDDRKIKDWVFT
jgi:hypothetical protein